MEKVRRTPASVKKLAEYFHMEILCKGGDYDTCVITVSDVFRPSLQLVGFYDYFDTKRLLILGKSEMRFLSRMTTEERTRVFNRLMSYSFPAMIISRNLEVFDELLEMAQKHGRTLLRTGSDTVDATSHIIDYLNNALAPQITRHGVLMNINGQGVLLLGESGIGKSETAIELVKRGHRLIADDAVEIKRVSAKTLVGSAPELIRHYIELRGIGIVDVRRIFGMGAVKETEKIDLVIHFEVWEQGKIYERFGMDTEYTDILGIRVPSITLPVKPGRNLAVIIEIAAMNNRQKKMGYNTAVEFNKKLMNRSLEPDTDR